VKNAPHKSALRTTLVAAALGVIGLVAGTSLSRADDKDKSHAHAGGVREHYQMIQGPQGPAMARDAMMKMAVHQYLLGETASDPELKRLAQTPELRRAIEEVRTMLKDQAAVDAKKAELLKDHDEMMMVLAHGLLKQDAETQRMLKAAEEGHGADHGRRD
jgi:hypothetical protein